MLRLQLMSTLFVLTLGAAALADFRPDGDPNSDSESGPLDELVAVTEDYVGDDLTRVPRGCDAISVFDASNGRILYQGETKVSPGRIASTSDFRTVLSPVSNGGAYENNGPPLLPFLSIIHSPSLNLSAWGTGSFVGADFARMGGVAVLPSDSELIVGLARTKQITYGVIPNLPPYHVAKYALSSRTVNEANIGRLIGSLTLGGVAEDIRMQPGTSYAHVLAGDDRIYTIDTATMSQVGVEIPIMPILDDPNYFFGPRIDYSHASLAPNDRYLITNRGPTSDVNVVDLSARSSYTASLGKGVDFVGGVSFNRGWVNHGVFAIHAVNNLITYEFDEQSGFNELARVAIDPPPTRSHRRLGQREAWDLMGPKFSIAWTGSGQYLVAATDSGASEFVVVRVDDSGRSLQVHQLLTACSASLNMPLGIHTLNGLITPPATATFVPTATETPSATPTATLTRTSTPTPVPTRTASPSATTTSSPTPTMQPAPLYIPLALSETCKREFRRVDLVLVLDTSSSMLDPTTTGRSKLDAAREAALSLVDSLDLSSGDRGGLVTFSETVTHRLAPTVRRDLLEATLMGLEASPGTCIPCGVEEGIQQLDALGVDPARTRTLVLLTDGLSTVRPIAEAITTARSAASRGIEIFTVGLGEDVEIEGLRQIASQPSHFYRTLDAESLADIFATIVTEIPCPASSFWGWR